MAGPSQFWFHATRLALVVVVVVAMLAPVTALASRGTRPVVVAAGSARLDLRFGAHARGWVVAKARVGGPGRVVVSVGASGLVLPALGRSSSARLEFMVAGLCGGRLGAPRLFSSSRLRVPGSGLVVPARRLSVRIPGGCAAGVPTGVFVRVLVVSLAPRLVLRTVSGSVSGLSSKAVSHGR